MTNFKVRGSYPARQFVEFCVAQEFQLEVTLKEEIVRISHYKGSWRIFFTESEDFIHFDDSMLVIESTNPLYEGFLQQRLDGEKNDTRKGPARAFVKLLEMKYGDLQQALEDVVVLQPGRNAVVDEQGAWTFSPRPEEFRLSVSKEVWS